MKSKYSDTSCSIFIHLPSFWGEYVPYVFTPRVMEPLSCTELLLMEVYLKKVFLECKIQVPGSLKKEFSAYSVLFLGLHSHWEYSVYKFV